MIYDAHVHFDMSKEKPYKALKNKLLSNSIAKCVLVLNSIEEEAIFLRSKKEIEKDEIVGAIAAIVDIRNIETQLFLMKMKREKINIAVKIHPRMTGITKKDFPEICQIIRDIGIQIVIIDDFIYGPEIESHVGTALAIYLSKEIQDIQVVLAHAGGCDVLKTMLLTRPLANIYYDYSLTCNYLEKTSVRQDLINGLRYTSNRIMFGTDYPDFDFEESKKVMEELCLEAGMTKQQMCNIFCNNALKIYGGELNNA